MHPQRVEPGPGQESVWDYPRPPIVVASDAHVRVIHRGRVVADTRASKRVLETSQPPAFYLPPGDVDMAVMISSPRRSICEWKGVASYWSIDLGDDGLATDAAWSYAHPIPGFASIADHLAFYAQAVDECWVDDERVVPNPGMFYGGWITSAVVGPFKGAAGTLHW